VSRGWLAAGGQRCRAAILRDQTRAVFVWHNRGTDRVQYEGPGCASYKAHIHGAGPLQGLCLQHSPSCDSSAAGAGARQPAAFQLQEVALLPRLQSFCLAVLAHRARLPMNTCTSATS
jgi:hypothetical protein